MGKAEYLTTPEGNRTFGSRMGYYRDQDGEIRQAPANEDTEIEQYERKGFTFLGYDDPSAKAKK